MHLYVLQFSQAGVKSTIPLFRPYCIKMKKPHRFSNHLSSQEYKVLEILALLPGGRIEFKSPI